MEYSEKIFEKKFSDEVSKNAYLKACKWLATHVYNKVELMNYILVKVYKEENKKNQFPTFTVCLYASVNIEDLDRTFCKKCKSLHTIFYSIDKPKCEECKKHAYKNELSRYMKSIKEYLNDLFEE